MASTPTRRSGASVWNWPSTQAPEAPALDKLTRRYLGFSLQFILILVILILALLASGFIAGFVVQTVRPRGSESGPPEIPVIDMNCSTNTAPATFIPIFYDDPVFSIFCNQDMPVLDLFEIFAPSFEACMNSCSSYRSSRAVKANESQSCEGVTFVPEWLNMTLATEMNYGGNCFLKHGPLLVSNLRPIPDVGGFYTMIAHSSIIVS